MHNLRVFFAILLPENTQKSLGRGIIMLQNTALSESIRWMSVNKMHVTLQFVGSLPQELIGSVIDNTKSALSKVHAFQLELAHLEWFPNLRHPKILSLSVQPQAALKNLSETIGDSLSCLNIPIENRPYRGHLTVGRLTQRNVSEELLATINVPLIPSIAVNKVYLIESRPERGGQNYYPLAEFKLG